MYNAQLETVHEAIAATSLESSADSSKQEDEQPIAYKVLDGPGGAGGVKSRAEEAAFQRRARIHHLFLLQRLTLSTVTTYCFQCTCPRRRRHRWRGCKGSAGGKSRLRHMRVRLKSVLQTREITMSHLRKVLATTRPSVPAAERVRLDRM